MRFSLNLPLFYFNDKLEFWMKDQKPQPPDLPIVPILVGGPVYLFIVYILQAVNRRSK